MSWFKKAFTKTQNWVDTTVIEPIEKTFTDVVDSAFGSDDLRNYTVLTKRNNITYYLWSDTRLNLIQPTYLITHGWNSAAVGDVDFRALVAAIKAYDSTANVLFVEWTEYSNTLNYATAVSSTFKVGLSVAIALLELGINIKNTHLIGHSLGSHVMGCAAAEYAQRANQSVQRIIALDPAGPVFENVGLSKRLDVTDARRVIAFHSTSTFGYDNALGHLDIYLNKWSQDAQPGTEGLTAIKTSHGYPVLVLKDLFRGYGFRQNDQSLFTYDDLQTRSGSHHINTRTRV
ncbi:MAG: hypothetical protein AAGA83_14385 [Cyanobacteria bacterium P01_F01_bin.116]